MKKLFALVCLVSAAFYLAVIGFAHPGRTEGNGGHYNYDTGEYHYHHGYPEHQHPNGECPYEENTTKKDCGLEGCTADVPHDAHVKPNKPTITTEPEEYNSYDYPTDGFKGDIYDYRDKYLDGEGIIKEYRAGECTQEDCPVIDKSHGHILRVTTTEHTEEYNLEEREEELTLEQKIGDAIELTKDICIGIFIIFSPGILGGLGSYLKEKFLTRNKKKRSRN